MLFRSEAIDQPSHADRKESANQRGPKIYAREVNAIDLQISEEWLGYQSETLCSARESSHHRQRRDKDVDPAVIERECNRRLSYFSSHKNVQKSQKNFTGRLIGNVVG